MSLADDFCHSYQLLAGTRQRRFLNGSRYVGAVWMRSARALMVLCVLPPELFRLKPEWNQTSAGHAQKVLGSYQPPPDHGHFDMTQVFVSWAREHGDWFYGRR